MANQRNTIARNTTGNIIEIFVANSSGKGVTGILNTAVNLRAWQRGKAGASVTANPVAGTIDIFLSNGWIEVDAVNLAGLYQYSIPNALLQIAATEIDLLFDFTSGTANNVLVEITMTAVPLFTGVQVSADGWDALPVEGFTALEAFKLLCSVAMGETTGAEGSKTIFTALGDNIIPRVESTSSDEKNRTLVKLLP